jgi:hypothetical protein
MLEYSSKKKRDLTIAGAVLTGLGVTTAVGAGIAYALNLNKTIIDGEFYKTFAIFNSGFDEVDLAASNFSNAKNEPNYSLTVRNASQDLQNVASSNIFALRFPNLNNEKTYFERIEIAENSYSNLSFREKRELYNFNIAYASDCIAYLEENNIDFHNAKKDSLQYIIEASKKELNTLNIILPILVIGVPALLISGVTPLALGLAAKVKKNKE